MQNSPEICDYENSPWRTAFWPGREYEDRAERIALKHMLPPRGARLCEIGAGYGRLSGFYSGYGRVVLLDYSRTMLEDAVMRLGDDPRFVYVAADLYHLPLADAALDTVVTVRVLHHIADIPAAMSEIIRVVRPAGIYLAEFANKRHLKARLRYALSHRGPNPNDLKPYEFVKLNFDFHPAYIREQLARAGFSIEDARAVSTFRLPLLKRLVPPSLLAGLDGWLQHPTRNWQISPSIFLRSRSGTPGNPVVNNALWRCPTCGSTDIENMPAALLCRGCARRYPIVNRIVDFRER